MNSNKNSGIMVINRINGCEGQEMVMNKIIVMDRM